MTGPELWSRFATWFEDLRRRKRLAAPWDILRIKPGPLLAATTSLMAFCLGDMGIGVIDSGNCNGGGGSAIGG